MSFLASCYHLPLSAGLLAYVICSLWVNPIFEKANLVFYPKNTEAETLEKFFIVSHINFEPFQFFQGPYFYKASGIMRRCDIA